MEQQMKAKERADAKASGQQQPKEKPKIVAKVVRTQDIIRFAETNIDSSKSVTDAIRSIAGIGHMLAHAIVNTAGVSGRTFSSLTESEVNKIEEIILHPEKYNFPSWMLNRRRDLQTGATHHLSSSRLDFIQRQDINELKKIRCYRGVRHSAGLPVRGQRTRSSFRGGKTVGVIRKKAAPGAAPATAPAGKGK